MQISGVQRFYTKKCKYFTLHFAINTLTANFATNYKTMANNSNINTFVLSDESVNSYGFIVQTAEIDTAQFERNPVMLYMNDRDNGVLGRRENIRREGMPMPCLTKAPT